MTPFFAFLKKMRETQPGLNSKDGGQLWTALSRKERDVYESEYREKAAEHEKYMLDQGFKPRKASRVSYEEKLSPLGKGVPDHIRPKRLRIVCSSERDVLPMAKGVYGGLGKVMVWLRDERQNHVGAGDGRYREGY